MPRTLGSKSLAPFVNKNAGIFLLLLRPSFDPIDPIEPIDRSMRWTDEGRKERSARGRMDGRTEGRTVAGHQSSVRDRATSTSSSLPPSFRPFLCIFIIGCSGDFIAITFINFLFTFKEAVASREGERRRDRGRRRGLLIELHELSVLRSVVGSSFLDRRGVAGSVGAAHEERKHARTRSPHAHVHHPSAARARAHIGGWVGGWMD